MNDIVTIFDKPIFLCVIETGHLAIYYISKKRTANIAYIKRNLPISTIDDLMKEFEYDDFEERLFKVLASENKERFELFLKMAQLNIDNNYPDKYLNFSYIIPINEYIAQSLNIVYTIEKDNNKNTVKVDLVLSNDKTGDFNIPIHVFTLDDKLDYELKYLQPTVSDIIKANVRNKIGKTLGDDYTIKIWNYIKNGVLLFSRRDYILPGSKLVELVTDDISEGELR